SPPAASPATSAASRRSHRSPSVSVNALASSATTASTARMLPWAANPSPVTPPAQLMHLEPVNVAARPDASTKPTCRSSRPSSSASSRSSAGCAPTPAPISSSPSGPNDVFAHDCVATAPWPARAHGTTAPTHGNLDATAMPQSPASLSAATIENVILHSPPSHQLERGLIGGKALEHDAAHDRPRLERTLGRMDRHLALLRQEHVQPAKHAPTDRE